MTPVLPTGQPVEWLAMVDERCVKGGAGETTAGGGGALKRFAAIIAYSLVATLLAGCGGSGTDSKSTNATSAVALADVCDEIPKDAHIMVLTGQRFGSGAVSLPEVEQILAAMIQRWTPAAKAHNVSSNEEGAASHLAGEMVNQLQQTSFAASHHEEPVFDPTDWTGGDLGTAYQRICGAKLVKS
jgi:hypothetical protein